MAASDDDFRRLPPRVDPWQTTADQPIEDFEIHTYSSTVPTQSPLLVEGRIEFAGSMAQSIRRTDNRHGFRRWVIPLGAAAAGLFVLIMAVGMIIGSLQGH